MPVSREVIAANLDRVRAEIAAAAVAAGRSASEVTLVAVTKYVGLEEIIALASLGVRDFGESRPQSLWEKQAQWQTLPLTSAAGPVRWHLVGHLQRNKVERTIAAATLIQSADSLRLLQAIDAAAAAQSRQVDVLLEVNISGDAAKHGFEPEELRGLLPTIATLPHLHVRGLMGMAALEGGVAVARQNFAALRNLRDALQATAPAGMTLSELSMGMSGDFAEAIHAGATIVRVGSALFETQSP